MLFQTMIITQTIALIFSQIDQHKIQSHPPIGHLLFTFRCFGSIKPISFYYLSTTTFYSYKQCEGSQFPIAHVLQAQEAQCVLLP